MLGSAPELGFVHTEYKNQGNEIIPQTGMGGNIPFCRLGLCDSGVILGEGMSLGRGGDRPLQAQTGTVSYAEGFEEKKRV